MFNGPEKPAVYEIMWKNMAEPDKSHKTIWRKHIACWVITDKDIHGERAVRILHCNNGCNAVLQSYVPRTLLALLDMTSVGFMQNCIGATHSTMTSRVSAPESCLYTECPG
jgi:hypothetical protein